MSPAERELRAVIAAALAEQRDDGATDDDLAELVKHVTRGLGELAGELAAEAAAVYAAGDEVPDFLPRVAIGAEFDPTDARVIRERFAVGGRLATRTWRIGELRRCLPRFAD